MKGKNVDLSNPVMAREHCPWVQRNCKQTGPFRVRHDNGDDD